MPFDEKGFLGEEIIEHSKDFKAQYSEIFACVENVNKFMMKTKDLIKIHPQEKKELIPSLLFAKFIRSFSSSVILSQYGLSDNAHVAARTCLEILFVLKAILNDESLIERYLFSGLIEYRKKLKTVLDNPERIPKGETEESLKKKYEELVNKIQECKAKKITVKQYSEWAGMAREYETQYSLWSDDVHPSVKSLDKFLELTHEGEPSDVTWGLDYDELPFLLLSVCAFARVVIASMINVFQLGLEEELKKIENEITQGFMKIAEK